MDDYRDPDLDRLAADLRRATIPRMANDNATAFGIDELRRAVNLFDRCRESFNQQFDAAELVAIWRAFTASGWDIPPDRWTERQVEEALKGRAPTFEDQERPTYDDAA